MIQRTPDGYAIPEDILSRWRKAYPSVDILAESARAFEWDAAQPKPKKNIQAFLVNWMARSQKENPVVAEKPAPSPTLSLPALSEEQVAANRVRFGELVKTTMRRMPS